MPPAAVLRLTSWTADSSPKNNKAERLASGGIRHFPPSFTEFTGHQQLDELPAVFLYRYNRENSTSKGRIVENPCKSFFPRSRVFLFDSIGKYLFSEPKYLSDKEGIRCVFAYNIVKAINCVGARLFPAHLFTLCIWFYRQIFIF